MEVSADQLKQAVEGQHGGRAALIGVEPVKETFNGATVWEGAVHVFDLDGHPSATSAYAWSSPVEGSDKRRFLCRAAPRRHPWASRCCAACHRGGEESEPMTDAEKLQRDIEGKLELIRLEWIKMAASLSPAERVEIRRSLELHLADLKDLISN